jgi:hypothetical protein
MGHAELQTWTARKGANKLVAVYMHARPAGETISSLVLCPSLFTIVFTDQRELNDDCYAQQTACLLCRLAKAHATVAADRRWGAPSALSAWPLFAYRFSGLTLFPVSLVVTRV